MQEAPVPEPVPVVTPQTIEGRIGFYADKYHLSGWKREQFFKTIRNESGFDPNVQSGRVQHDGSQEQSFGLAQIHLPDHPEISKEQALDPEFALDFMAQKFATLSPQALGNLWHAYRDLYLK